MDKNYITTLLKEQLEIKLFETQINDLIILCEDESRTFEWIIAKNTIDKATSSIKTKSQAEKFFNLLVDKVKNLPHKIKRKIIKYVSLTLMGLLTLNTISGVLSAKSPEIKDEVVNSLQTNIGATQIKTKTPNKVSERLVNFIKHEEGSVKQKGEPVLKGYKLGDNMITIGWGHAEKLSDSKYKEGQVISKNEAERLLKQDIGEAEDAINDILRAWDESGIEYSINQEMYDAMVSMVYNMGRGGFRTSNFIQLVKQGKYEEAEQEIKQTSNQMFNKFRGLKNRRAKESHLFGKGVKKLQS